MFTSKKHHLKAEAMCFPMIPWVTFQGHASLSTTVLKLWCKNAVDKYHKVPNLTLKWCKMSFYLILFQCEIWNMTSLDIKYIWVCTFHTGIFRWSKSQIQRHFDWISWRFRNELKNSPYKNVQTHIFEMWRHLMFLDVNTFRTGMHFTPF